MNDTSLSCDPKPRWIKASKSVGTGACIELAIAGERLLVRDSKNPQIAPLSYTRPEFEAFLDGAKKGEFDELAQKLTTKEERARSLSSTGATSFFDTLILTLIVLKPATLLGWITAFFSAVAMLIVSLSLVTGVEVLPAPGGALIIFVALLVLTVSRRLTVFKGRHLHS